MQLGMIGLGRMGANMVRRLMRGGHQCVVFDRSPKSVEQLAAEGAAGAASLDEFAEFLREHRGELDGPDADQALFDFRDRMRNIVAGETVSDSTMF